MQSKYGMGYKPKRHVSAAYLYVVRFVWHGLRSMGYGKYKQGHVRCVRFAKSKYRFVALWKLWVNFLKTVLRAKKSKLVQFFYM